MNATRKAHLFAGANAVMIVLAALLITVMLNYLSVRHYRKFDVTKESQHTLSEKTVQVLKALKEPVTVSAVIAEQELASPEVKEQITALLDSYKGYSDKLKVVYVSPDDRIKVQELGVTALNTIVFAGPSGRQLVNVNSLTESDDGGMSFGGPQTLKAFKGEEAFTNALASLSEQKLAVCFTEGHGELQLKGREAEGLAMLDALVAGENYDTQTLSTRGPDPIPPNCAVVVVAGPEIPFAPEEAAKIDAYLKNQGRLLLMAETLGAQAHEFLSTGLEPLLQSRGLALHRDLVFDPKLQVKANVQEPMMAAIPAAGHMITQSFNAHKVPVILPISRSLQLAPPAAEGAKSDWQPLLSTSPEGIGITDLKEIAGGTLSPSKNDLPGPLVLAAARGGGDESGEKLVVVGSARFTSNLFGQDTKNTDFIVNAIHWLAARPARIAIPARKLESVSLAMTRRQVQFAALWLILGAPGLVLVGGILLFIRRRQG
jgi:hypothetical protein